MVRQNEWQCPCESGLVYLACCGPLLSRTTHAETAEALMRSRYTAYVRNDLDYLQSTWHPEYRPEKLPDIDNQKWLGLKIRRVEGGDKGSLEGIVEFVARFKSGSMGSRLHEISRFVWESDRWYYTTGEFVE